MDSRILNMQEAITAESKTLQQLNSERNEVMRILFKARYVDACDLHIIESKYTTKIANFSDDIKNLKQALKELESNA
jgi:seryl-tRNA synthetase